MPEIDAAIRDILETGPHELKKELVLQEISFNKILPKPH